MSEKSKLLNVLSDNDSASNSISRRSFLKVLGAASAAGVTACAKGANQNIFPNVKGEDQQIPGVAVWYRSTCTECSAGCGITVRTREGRAVKIEGNSDHPVNRGGLCALGQSSLQALYDPDRIRQPLKKTSTGFVPVSWSEALGQVATWLKESKHEKAIITGENSGALNELLDEFCSKLDVHRATWDLLEPVSLAKASELTFGIYGIPNYKFDRADTIVNFGADFLETWVSPCEFARDWSIARKKKKPVRVVHIEPRLSLTGANADLWLSSKPGTEVKLALALLKVLFERGKGEDLNAEVKNGVKQLVSKINLADVAQETGVEFQKITLVAQYLADSESPLVIAGGASASTEQSVSLVIVANLINLLLGSVGKTVVLSNMKAPQTSMQAIAALVDYLKRDKESVDVLFVHGTNPAFTLPAAFGFKYAAKRAAHIVSFSSHLDETTALADLILPSHTSLESWGDVRKPGVFSLVQPTMQPVFDTKPFGDMLLEIAAKVGKPINSGANKTFESYLKESWKKIHVTVGAKTEADFVKFWNNTLEKGVFADFAKEESKTPQVNAKAFSAVFDSVEIGTNKAAQGDLIVYPYPSIKSFDGRAANRPWMQELADPISQIVWDSWAEIHPETAKAKGLQQGDIVGLNNFSGEINVPLYLTKHVAKGVVAVPIGQGHSSYGRWAKEVKGGNVLDLLPGAIDKASGAVALLSAKVIAKRAPGHSNLVVVQGSDSQQGRELARTDLISAASSHSDDHANDHHAGHHEVKQMYTQREHPTYSWGLAVDLAACTGCSACVVACYAENNIPVVGKARAAEGREMTWLRIERYYDNEESEEFRVSFLPMMCQHCGNAPCEPVCPVYATYHNEEGLNAMIYNRCVGTRYCSNNCSYKVRRFNWFEYELPEPLNLQLNPDVTKRAVGVMEKCSFCVQRIAEAKDRAKDLGRMVQDGEVQPACVQSCPTQALTFGDLNDPNSKISHVTHDHRAYKVLDHHLNTQPAVTYLNDVRYKI
jgi:anaerobic selenocysteine-containing dehydrogenase/Fe-S-cluster-containing dehydrogenase component